MYVSVIIVFFKQKTAYELRISDWSSDVCSSDLINPKGRDQTLVERELAELDKGIKALAYYIDGSPYAVGGKLSFADCTLAPMLFFYEQKIGRASCRERVYQYV